MRVHALICVLCFKNCSTNFDCIRHVAFGGVDNSITKYSRAEHWPQNLLLVTNCPTQFILHKKQVKLYQSSKHSKPQENVLQHVKCTLDKIYNFCN